MTQHLQMIVFFQPRYMKKQQAGSSLCSDIFFLKVLISSLLFCKWNIARNIILKGITNLHITTRIELQIFTILGPQNQPNIQIN